MATVPYAMLALAQSGTEAPPAVAPSDFQLKPPAAGTRVTPERCPEGRPGDIVVCGRRRDEQRLQPLPPLPGVGDSQSLGIALGGGRLEPHVSEVVFPNGQVSKRVTIDWKIAF